VTKPAGGISAQKRELLALLLKKEGIRQVEEDRIERRAPGTHAPVSFSQQPLWFLDQLEPGSALYNITDALRLNGPLDLAAMHRTLGELARRHEAFRTSFTVVDGEPVQVVADAVEVELPVDDLSHLEEPQRGEELRRRVAEHVQAPFDLARAPLLYARLFRLSESEHVLGLSTHHIISDGWSMGVFARELGELYQAFSAGLPSPLGEVPLQFTDFAAWQRRRLSGKTLDDLQAYWRGQLEGAPPMLELPTDRPRPPRQRYRGASQRFILSHRVMEGVRELNRREGTTLFMALLAVWDVLLARWSGQDRIVVGSPIANRTRKELESTIGFFVNTLALHVDLSGDPTFRDVLRRVRETTLGAYAHQELPFERLVEVLQPERSLSYAPVFQVMFVVQNAPAKPVQLSRLVLSPVEADSGMSVFDVSLFVDERVNGIHAAFRYNPDLFDAATLRRMGAHFQVLAEAIVADPDRPLSELPILTAAERAQLVVEWNRTERPFDLRPVHERIAEQARLSPAAPAVVFRGETLTYAELDRRADALAATLRERGAAPERRVAILLERSPEMVVAVLAVLKAGAAYVPVDPGYPAERVAYVLEDSGASLLISADGVTAPSPPGPLSPASGRKGEHGDAADGKALSHSRTSALSHSPFPENAAYVIYTSGSTGRPKGVVVPHRALASYTEHARAEYGIGAEDRVLQFASLVFDASAEEIFPALASGAALVLRTDEMIDSPAVFARACGEWGITVASLPTAYWHELAGATPDELPELPDALRLVIIGGERAVPERLEAWRGRFGTRVRLVNTYGPTEATIVATLADVAEPEPADPVRAEVPEIPLSPVPIGRPVSNARAYVLDAHLRPVPTGVAGELFMGGAGVARGYLGRPGLTAGRFVPDALSGEPGARLYRTGDRVRWRPDGRLEFLGRTDAQVKVRGFRIEPGEVEAALARHPAVRECVVVAREDEPGAVRLVAYVAPAEGAGAPDAAELRRFLGATLPPYMVPSAVVALDAFPLTASGKLDRRALPAPDGYAADAGGAPRTPVEEIVAGIFAEVLRLETVGIHDGFFDLGGHSLLATQAMSRLRAALHVDLPLRVLFEAPTVASLARLVEAALPDAVAVPPILPAPRGGDVPLSFAQERLWFLDHLEPGSPFYNVPGALRLRGPLDAAALEWAFGEIVRRHEALRTVFPSRGGRAVQRVLPPEPFSLPVEELRGLPDAAREATVRTVVADEVRHAFDLARGPLLRARLLRVADDEHVLVTVMHHVVSDAWSMGIFFGEMGEAYRARLDGRDPALPPLPVQYADFAVWQREWLRGETLERQLGWWRERLRGAPAVLELPTDRPRPPVQRFHGASHGFAVPEDAARALRALGRREGATPFMVLLAAFQLLLARYAGQDDVVVGTPIAGRNRQETERLIGFFVNTLALRTELWDDPSFRELVGRVRETTLGAYQHQDLPFERLVEELQPERSLSRTPLFQVMFVFQNVPPGGLDLGGVAIEPLEFEFRSEKFDLTLTMLEHPEGLLGGVQYSTDLFDAATVERMCGHLVALLAAAAQDPARPVSGLRLLGDVERAQLVAAAGGTRSFPVHETLHGRFAAAATRAPGAPAATLGAESLTYAELDRRAADLAHALRRRGVGPEVRVGLCLERSLEMVVAILAVLRAGGAYVPIDPAYPADRIAYLLEDSGVALVLAQEATRGVLGECAVEVVAIDTPHPPAPSPTRGEGEHDSTEDAGALSHSRTFALSHSPSPDSAAYVIYTSGSTGRPKGVVVTHANVLRLFDATREWFGFGADDVWTLFHSYAFDFSVWEIWGALLHGGRLVVVPFETSRDPEAFRALLGREGVTVLNQTPSAFRQLVRADEAAPADDLALRRVVFGGEALEPRSLKPWFDRRGDRSPLLVNMYGITETTVHVTHRPVTAEDAESSPGSVIGEGIPDLSVHLLDRHLEPVPAGVPGEMFVGGGGVARGYLGRPELTAERFVPDPFGAPGARMYRSGDRARRRAGGGLEYLGRADQQVKVRGFRIEPGEIEAALLDCPGVREALVVAREDEPGSRRLVAYLVADGADGEVTVDSLRARLAERLPEYMVPAAWVLLEKLPLTPHGKVDRGALPLPDGARPELGAGYAPPRDAVEAALAEVWADTLGLDRVGVHDNYFALGGDSIRSLQVLAKARERGIGFGLQDVFRHQTIAELAPHVRAERRDDTARAEPFSLLAPEDRARVPEGLEDAYPMTRLQLGMIFHTEQHPDRAVYQNVNTFHIRAAFDGARLRSVLDVLARRHGILRTSFDLAGFSEPVQRVHREVEIPLEVADLSGRSAEAQDAEIDGWMEAERLRPFDWREAPLIRFHAHVRGPDAFQLGFAEHHSILDGWSVAALLAELFGLYFAAGDADGETAAPASTFRDFVALERETLDSPEARRFWAEVLEDAESTVPPSLAPAGESGARGEGAELPAELVDGLTRVARRAGATLKSVLLAAHLRVIGAAAGADDVTVGIVANGRPEGGDGERVLGLFLNTLPLRVRPGRGSWLDLVRAAFDAERRMLPFRRFPVAELQRMNGGAPPFEVLFNFVHFHVMDRVAAEEGERFVRARSTGTTNFPLAVSFAQGVGGGGIQLALEYDAARFSDAQVERLLAGYLAVLGRMAEEPDARHDALDLLPPEERERVLVEWNATAPGRPADTPVHELFAASAARTPDAPAISFRGTTVTYAELERGANFLAHRLRALGVGPESRVGLLLERSPELVAAMLAVLEAGGAYVPLDPEYPAERVAYMLADSGATVLLTSEHLLGALPEFGGEIVVVDEAPSPPGPLSPASGRKGENDGSENADALSHSRTFALSHSQLAYLIYTSGSTGTPKGVAVPHGALAAQIAWMQRAFPLDAADRVLQRTPFSFDASVWEIWAPLAAGATLVMAEPGEHREPARLARLMAAGRVTVAQFVPTLLGALLEEELSACTAVRRVFAGGEALPAELAARAGAALGAEVVNLYGPTEVCINATSHVFAADGGAAVPIGRPVDHVRAYVLDRDGEPVSVGVPGELYLGGVQVARGYLGRPGTTAGSFVPDGLSGEAGARLYRTGDRVRWLPGGVLEFLGRVDQQVKLRGFRIEPGEVEAVLRGHPGVADAVVDVRGDGAGERRLVAWLVPSGGGAAPDAAELRGWMRGRLPEHMVPSAFAALEALPLTPSGKTDRRALPDPERASAGDAYVAPRTPTEERLAAAWADVLRAGRVGVRDSFFDLGGHSLLATQVVSRVRASFGVELLVADLFLNPTVESLARRVDGLLAAGAPADAVGNITRQARRGVARRTSPQ
jgi:amino acid adenylation domain-containing protein